MGVKGTTTKDSKSPLKIYVSPVYKYLCVYRYRSISTKFIKIGTLAVLQHVRFTTCTLKDTSSLFS